MNTKTLIALALATLTLAPRASNAQNLLTNGSFEIGPFVNDGFGFQSLPVGSTLLPGWTVIIDGVARGNNGVPNGGALASEGAFFLDLESFDNLVPHGGVAQTIVTSSGQTYHLSFDLGTLQDYPVTSGPITVSASAGTSSVSFVHNPSGPGNQWGSYGFDFTAGSPSTVIAIRGISGINYIGLDNVSVVRLPDDDLLASIHCSTVDICSAVDICWAGRTNQLYRVQFRTNLSDTNWFDFGSPVVGHGTNCVTDGINGMEKRFYRVIREP